MIVSSAELTGLAAISGGGRLPGFPPPRAGKAEAELALARLRVKGVLDASGRVSRLGMVPIRAVEQYLRADQHVYLNQLKVSLNDDGALTVLHPIDDDWDLSRMSPQAVMLALLRAYPWLCEGDGPDASASPWKPMSLQRWAQDRLPEQVPPLVMRCTSKLNGASQPIAYDLRRGSGFAYGLDDGAGRVMPVWQIRTEIATALGCAPDAGAGDLDG